MNILNFITWNPSPEIFNIGGFSIRWYGLLFAMGFFFAYLILFHVFSREKIEIKLLDRLTVYIFLATVIGARLGHVFFYQWDYYKNNLGEIPLVWKGGLASHGAGIAIILALIIFIKVYKVNIWWLFDRISIVIPVAAAFVRFGNLANSEIYGIPTKMPWGFVFPKGEEILTNDLVVGAKAYPKDMVLSNIACHPTQIYEALSYLAISLILYLVWRKNKSVVRPGLMVGLFLVLMFTARFLIEFVKIPQEKFVNTTFLDMGQWLSIPFVLLGAFFLFWAFRKKKGEGENEKTHPAPEGT